MTDETRQRFIQDAKENMCLSEESMRNLLAFAEEFDLEYPEPSWETIANNL